VPRSGAPGEGRQPLGFSGPHLIALRAISPLPQGERESDLVLAMHPHPSFAKPVQDVCLQIKRREAERRKARLSRGASPRQQMLPPVRASGVAARPAGRARLSALHRGSRQAVTPDSASGRVSWNRRVRTGGPSPAPVQRAPRGPVIMPDERGPKAARERFARPRAGTAPAPHLDRIRNAPFGGRVDGPIIGFVSGVKNE
jgi:hypothetical protein